LKNPKNHEALLFVAEKCIQKGYTTFSELLKLRNKNQPFKMMIKYDERFAFFSRNINSMLSDDYSDEDKKNISETANKIIFPYPFSQALSEPAYPQSSS